MPLIFVMLHMCLSSCSVPLCVATDLFTEVPPVTTRVPLKARKMAGVWIWDWSGKLQHLHNVSMRDSMVVMQYREYDIEKVKIYKSYS